MNPILYKVATFRAAGLEAKWTRTSQGSPIIVARNPAAKLEHQRKTWWTIDRYTWVRMQKEGIVEAFECCTLLGDVFSIPA